MMRRPVHIVLVCGFVVVLGIWTYLLITPQPVPEKLFDGVSWFDKEMLIFLLAKATHLCVYAGFSFGVALLFRTNWCRWFVWVGLIVHGATTEAAQYLLRETHHRHGCIRDVLIDATGIAIGGYAGRQIAQRIQVVAHQCVDDSRIRSSRVQR